MRLPLAAAVIVIALLGAAVAQGGDASQPAATQPGMDAALAAKLSQIDAQVAGISDLSAKFTQRKYTPILKKPLVSTGVIRAVGNAVRWDTQTPEPSVLYAASGEFRLYYPDQKLEEIYPVNQKLGDLLASPLPRLAAIREHFTIERGDVSLFKNQPPELRGVPAPLVMRLTPTDNFIKQHVREVTVAIDEKSGLAVGMQTIDTDGDATEMFFSDVKVNQGTRSEELELKTPEGTEVSHPMADEGSGK